MGNQRHRPHLHENRDVWHYDFDVSNYNDNFGIGLRLMIGGAPLSLDFGIPLTSSTNPNGTSNDEGLQFNFSFGTRF